MTLAIFGINDGTLNLAVNLVIFVLVVVWLALVYWTFADARRRIEDPVLVTTATLVSLAPYIGTMVYTILRPPEFLADARERQVETEASELRMRHLVAQSCPRCQHPIERTWLRCPECQYRLKDPCRSCNRPVDPRWAVCPYCETPMRSQPSSVEAGERQRPRPSRVAEGARAERPSQGGSAAPPQRRADARAAQRSAAERPQRERPDRPPPRSGPPEPSPARSSAPEPEPGSPGAQRQRRRSTTTS